MGEYVPNGSKRWIRGERRSDSIWKKREREYSSTTSGKEGVVSPFIQNQASLQDLLSLPQSRQTQLQVIAIYDD